MLSNYIEYREKDDIENILKWEPNALMKNLGPYKILGLDSKHLPVVDLIMQIVKKFESFHPETVKSFYFINAGRAFAAFFAMVKPILGPGTADKFRFVGSNPDEGFSCKHSASIVRRNNKDAEAVATVDNLIKILSY